ncbi:hypothetical protein PISL3812_09276 [Talaromyces islandicus]|uniref:DUF3752 domain-containing protein n=1 Tax=Talaromyces islandicus TaxID=28573 RepID=A0A0U1MB54_TALIS|nr:hypothetical protein PISL3812_09276 [Talaromyces islandicus]
MSSTTPTSAKRKREDEPSSPAPNPPQVSEPARAPRVIGPTVPHHLASHTASDTEAKKPSEEEKDSDDSDDSDDDDFGPQLPPAAGTQAAKRNENSSWDDPIDSRNSNEATEKASSKPVERDEWMVVPPTKGSWASGTQGAPLQNRKFTTGRSARSSAATEGGAASAWTEDPSQKRLRLENEVLGIQVQNKTTTEKKPQSTRHNEITAKKLKDTRGQEKKPSLLETHKQRSQKADEDDPSARPFDREKDIAGPANISNASRKEMLNRASDYSSRFSGGKYL